MTYRIHQFKDGTYGVRVFLFGFIPWGYQSLYSSSSFSDNFTVNEYCKTGDRKEAEYVLRKFRNPND